MHTTVFEGSTTPLCQISYRQRSCWTKLVTCDAMSYGMIHTKGWYSSQCCLLVLPQILVALRIRNSLSFCRPHYTNRSNKTLIAIWSSYSPPWKPRISKKFEVHQINFLHKNLIFKPTKIIAHLESNAARENNFCLILTYV